MDDAAEDFSVEDAADEAALTAGVDSDRVVALKNLLADEVLAARSVPVDEVAFDQLTAAQLAELGDDRFDEYLDWKLTGAQGVADGGGEDEVEEPRPLPSYVSVSEAEFQAAVARVGDTVDSYGSVIGERERRARLIGEESS